METRCACSVPVRWQAPTAQWGSREVPVACDSRHVLGRGNFLLTQLGASQLRREPQQQPDHSQPHLAARVEKRAPVRRARQRLSQLQPVRQRWPARRRLLPQLPQQRDGTHAHLRVVGLAQARVDLPGKQPRVTSAAQPSTAPRQRRVQPRAASSLGKPRPIGRCALAGRAHRTTGLAFHRGWDGAEQRRAGAQQA